MKGSEKKWYIAYNRPSVPLLSMDDYFKLWPAICTRGSKFRFKSTASELVLSFTAAASFSSNPSLLTSSINSAVRLPLVLIRRLTLRLTSFLRLWSKLYSKNCVLLAKRLSLLRNNVRVCIRDRGPVVPTSSAVTPRGNRHGNAPEINSGLWL